MAILRYIDIDGRENDVQDVNHLYELIQGGRVNLQSFIWDETQQRWIVANDHEFFRRIREIAATANSPRDPVPLSAAIDQTAIRSTPEQIAVPQDRELAEPGYQAEPKKQKSMWFKAISTREEALKTIRDTSAGFFVVAALQAVIGVWLATQYPNSGFDIGETLIDVAIYLIFATWLRWGRSRTAAVILLLTATVALGTTIGAHLKIIQGGKNIWLAGIIFWAAVKAVEATFKLRGRFKHEAGAVDPQFGSVI